jgi:hypothetical protein
MVFTGNFKAIMIFRDSVHCHQETMKSNFDGFDKIKAIDTYREHWAK